MIALLIFFSMFGAELGKAVQLTFPHEQGIRAIEMDWQKKRVPFVRVEDKWLTVIGVDLDMKPGEHRSDVFVTMEDGNVSKRDVVVNVADVNYPTTELQVAEQFVQLSPANQERAAREAEEIAAIHAVITPEILWTGTFAVPIPGRTGSNFGHRRIFNGERRAPHSGADLRATTGTPIRSTNRGRVVLAKNLFFTGNTVIVDHGLGIYSLYAHLSRIDVKKGAVVEQGKVVGLAGATGRVTGPHLHWGIRIQGARVDPYSLLELKPQM